MSVHLRVRTFFLLFRATKSYLQALDTLLPLQGFFTSADLIYSFQKTHDIVIATVLALSSLCDMSQIVSIPIYVASPNVPKASRDPLDVICIFARERRAPFEKLYVQNF
jgi:hypothetical protein